MFPVAAETVRRPDACRRVALLLVSCAWLLPAAVEAADFTRVAPGSGLFTDPQRWSPTGVPGPMDRAIFNLSSNYSVLFSLLGSPINVTNERLRIGDDDVTFNMSAIFGGASYTLTSTTATSLSIGGGFPFPLGTRWDGRLRIQGGTFTTQSAVIGDGPADLLRTGSGLLEIGSGGIFNSSGILSIGLHTPGTLTIHNGGEANTFFATIGDGSGGTATVTGGGSTWTSNTLDIGSNAGGTLNIQNEGVVTTTSTTEAYVGVASGATGAVNVAGTSSRWNHAGAFVIGRSGTGILHISAGGQVESSRNNTISVIADQISSSGSVTVEGTDSRWRSTNLNHTLTVGNQGDGSLTISGGGNVTFSRTTIGAHPFGSGTVDVEGSGSRLDSFFSLIVGSAGSVSSDEGVGALRIGPGAEVVVGAPHPTRINLPGTVQLDGGKLQTGRLEIAGGAFNWTSGMLHLTGSALKVEPGGLFGASLDIGAGKILRALRVIVGEDGNGTLTASDGALIHSEEYFTVGSADDDGVPAEGAVHVSNAGLLTNFHSTLGSQPGSEGTVTIESGGFWEHLTPFNVTEYIIGDQGIGTLNVHSGGMMSVLGQAVPILGNDAQGVGSVNIDGSGSEMFIDLHDLTVGRFGQGTVNITGGGSLAAPDSLVIIAEQPGAVGEVSLEGDSMMAAGAIVVGAFGTGSIAVENGAAVEASEIFIALGEDSSGTVVVDGIGSRLTALSGFGNLIVGGASTGSLTVIGGGVAEAKDVILGDGMTGIGDGLVSGPGSRLTATDEILVGFMGAGELTVANGGVAAAPVIEINEYSTVRGDAALVGDVVSHGTVAPGLSTGVLAIDGDYVQQTDGALEIELGGTTPGAFDVLAITGSAMLDGTLDVSLVGGFSPSAGDTFEILTAAGGVNSTFGAELLPSLAGGLSFEVIYGTNSVTLAIAGLPGDFNLDGVVDAADYTVWRDGLGTTFTQAHYDVWKQNFGNMAAPAATLGSSSHIAVPEPASLLLVAAAVLPFLIRGRGKGRESFAPSAISRQPSAISH